MKIRIVLFICALSISSMLCWGQTWKLSETMSATLDNGIMTVTTTADSEAMPDFDGPIPWYDDHYDIHTIEFEGNITAIGKRNFFNFYNLRSLTIPNSVTEIRELAFGSCHNIENLTLSESLISIGKEAFQESWTLTDITLPNSLIEIGTDAFKDCSSLTTVALPDKLTTILGGAFYGCTSLTEITIPASVTSIGNGTFMACEKLEALHVAASNAEYASVDGVLYNKDKTTLIYYPEGKKNTSFVILGTVQSIEANACLGTKFTSVTIPESVTAIGPAAFYKSSLQSVNIPKAAAIGYKVFAYCTEMTSFTVAAGNENLSAANGILYNKDKSLLIAYPASKGGDFVIPDHVKEIEGYAFSGATGLQSVTIPNSVTSIEEFAFHLCEGLTSVTMSNALEFFGASAFLECPGLTSFTIPGSVKEMGLNIFNDCIGLKEVTVEWTTPYAISDDNDIFWGVDKAKATLNVPTGTKALYQAAHSWKDFGKIDEYVSNELIDIPTLKAYVSGGVLYISGLPAGMAFNIYTINGQLVYQGIAHESEAIVPIHTSGIYIVIAEGKALKIMVNGL